MLCIEMMMLLDDANGFNGVSEVKNCLTQCGLGYIWQNQTTCSHSSNRKCFIKIIFE